MSYYSELMARYWSLVPVVLLFSSTDILVNQSNLIIQYHCIDLTEVVLLILIYGQPLTFARKSSPQFVATVAI